MTFCLDEAILDTDIIAGEKPPQVVQANSVLLNHFQAAKPDLKGQIQPEECVRKSLQVIERLNLETSGLLLSHNGDQERWF